MIHKIEIMNIWKDQKRGKGAISGFDRALLGLGVSIKIPRKMAMKRAEI